jgi:uncharacterized protein YutE (UPF0331/DUF86 family)
MMNVKRLSDLVNIDSPKLVLDEIQVILDLISPDFNAAPVTRVFKSAVELYTGNYPGYRACNTLYHDLRHTTDTVLAMARLIHGAVEDGEAFTDRQVVLGLIAALFHDAGYIQQDHDREGTGAKYTASHVQRSMDFLQRHGAELELSDEEIAVSRAMVLCTDLTVDISTIAFPSARIEMLGKMLAAADILAQMADRTYLEKLLFLYYEFREAGVGGYESETDLLRKTVGFHDFIAQRLATMLDGTDRFMISHFAGRWDIHTNLYHEAMENHRKYLKQILDEQDTDPPSQLKRRGVV